MATKKIGRTAEEQALYDYIGAGDEFVEDGAAQYQKGDDAEFSQLNEMDRLGPSAYGDIKTDPTYKNNELEALRQLEEQSRDGYSAQDKADLGRIEQNSNRANRGRQGAIDQQIQGRGLGGSGLEFALKQQAAQDAAEQEALSGLEVNAQMQNRKQSAAQNLGQLSSQLQNNEFSQSAQKAQAADAISRFNTQNSNARQQYNNQGVNSTAQQNFQRANQTADNQTNADYGYRKDSLGVGQSNATTEYNNATDMYNREEAKKAAAAKKKSGMGSAIGGVIGGVAGAYFGGPAGAAAGASVGSSVGGSMAHGGKVKGPEITQGDNEQNDVIPIRVSAGEIVIPKSHAKDPMKAAKFVAEQNGEELDPVAMLLEAMQQLRKK